MARHHNPTLTTSGLILCLDVNNPRGYDQGTPSLTDLTKRGTTVQFFNSPGAAGDHVAFDGTNDFIRVTRDDLNAGSFQPDYITMCMWIMPDGTASTGDNNVITVENSFEVKFRRINGTNYASVQWASNPWAWVGPTSGVLLLNEWNHLTFVHGLSSSRSYVNGELRGIYTYTSGSRPLAAGRVQYPYLTIGGRYTGTSSRTKGKIASVLLYDRELSDEEISKNFYAKRGKYNV